MPYVMEVPATHRVRVKLQMRFPNADPAVLHAWSAADLVEAQAQVDPYYARGIRVLQRIDSRITRIAHCPSLDAVRERLQGRAARIRSMLCDHLGIPREAVIRETVPA